MTDFARDVREALLMQPQRELPSQYFYDAIGSALFEAITLLAEYGLTRADERLLEKHAPEIIRAMTHPMVVVELGSGSGRKTRWILDAEARREPHYFAIDVSAEALHQCANELGGVARVETIEDTYLSGLGRVARRRRAGDSMLVLFLGSTIGNFHRPAAIEFLRGIRAHLRKGDALLLGTDLVKPASVLIPAYDDPAGITAAFNLNLLARINRELGADFVLRSFAHEVRYNRSHHRMEMHLQSLVDQTVTIPAAATAITLREGETIWTEASYKYHPADVDEMARLAGFDRGVQFVDREWPFAETLLRVN